MLRPPSGRPIIAILIVLFLFAINACKHGKCEDGGSSNADRESHNVGRNCLSCHHPDGEGEGCWNVGGTIYDHSGNNTMAGVQFRLFTLPRGQGEVKLALQSDRTGNVYTSQDVNFGYGLFPAVINSTGDTAFMDEPIRDGACNRCHGDTQARVELP